MDKKIIVFATNTTGGIAQYSLRLAMAFAANNYKVVLMAPKAYEYSEHGNQADNVEVVLYEYVKSVIALGNKKINHVVDKVLEISPELVIYTKDLPFSMQVSKRLGKKVKQAMVIHDIVPHLSYFNLKDALKAAYIKSYFKSLMGTLDYLVLPSRSNYNDSLEYHKSFKGKRVVIPLGEHLILNHKIDKKSLLYDFEESDYLLFVGRIDRYKGIEVLLKAYKLDVNEQLPKLLLMGSGQFSEEEQRLLGDLKGRIIRLDAFIRDDEMKLLVSNAKVVVLPYIETSQSGVLPIAYKCGKPVITSSVYGLAEFVEDRMTGLIFNTQDAEDLYNKMQLLCEDEVLYNRLCENVLNYSERILNWEENVANLIRLL